MIKEQLRNKLEEMKKNSLSNKGFTLVELIVVIVILAILVGVTIGGIYMYVGQSRAATDTNNASAITSTLSTMAADEDIYALAGGQSADVTLTMTWTNKVVVDKIGADDGTKFTGGTVASVGATGNEKTVTNIYNYMKKVLTNGLPKSQTGKGFTLEVKLMPDDNGSPNVSVNCTVNE